jgi:hypothetical protein
MAAHTESTPVSTAGNATNGGPLSTPFEPLETNSSRPLSILQSLRTAVTSVQSASSRVLASALASSGQVSAAKAHSSLEEAIDLIASDVSKKEPSQGDAEISASLDAD